MLSYHSLAASGYEAGELTGRIIGLSVVVMLAGAGILKCAALMRRPLTSSLCVSSLLVFLAGWLLSTLMVQIPEMLGWPPVWKLLAGVLFFLLALVSVILAVAGLVVMGHRRGHYNQGKAQAVWALVLSGLLVLLGVGGFMYARFKDEGGTEWTASSKEAGKRAPFSGLEDHPDFNFRLARPVAPWTKVPSQKVMPAAAFLVSAANPEMYFACIAEENSGLSRDDLKEIGQARIRGMADHWEAQETGIEVRGGLTFVRARSRVQGLQGKNLNLAYEVWYASTAKYAYQFMFWGKWPERGLLAAEAERWMDTFSLIAPDPEVRETGTLEDGEFSGDGYATTLGQAGWKPEAAGEFEEAHLVARKAGDRLAVVCLPLPEGVQLRAAEIDHRLLQSMHVTEKEQLKGPEETVHEGMPGRRYRFVRTMEGLTLGFEVRILQQDQMVWMLVLWGDQSTAEDVRQAGARAVRFFPPRTGPAPLTPVLQKSRSLMLNDLGIACYQRQDFTTAEALFRAAQRLQPGDAAIAGNILDALQQMGKQEAALETVQELMQSGPLAGLPVMRAKRAQLLSGAGNPAGASAEWQALFDSGYANEDHFLEWLNVMHGMEEYPKALTAVERYSKAHSSPRVTRWHASVLARNDRWDDAFGKLEPLIARGNPDKEALYLRGELENEAGRYEAAAKTAGRLVDAGESTARAWLILGWSEWHRKGWKAAREAFEKAADKAPESAVVKEALAMTAGALGQGTAEVSRTPLEPVVLPDAVKEAIAAHPAPPESLLKGHGAVLLERHTGCYFKSGEPCRVTQSYRVKVLDASGVEAFSTLALLFYPSAEQVHVNRLVVRDEGGTIIQQGSTSDAYTTAESGDLATGAHVLRVPVAGLRRGCTLEAQFTVQDKTRSTVAPFRRDLLVSAFPAVARAWYFTGDTSQWKFATAPDLRAIKEKGAVSYLAFHTPAYRSEGFMPPLDEWQPWGMAGPAGANWETIASDYLKRIVGRLEPDESTLAVWNQIQREHATDVARLGAIIRHVQASLTYKGLEFGTRAMIPSTVAKIQQDQYGDCKDHTLLLYHLLRRAGIPCHPALVDTGWKLRPELPSLDQFDHMILHVPLAGRQPWIDATDEWLDLMEYTPDGLAGRQALILDPARPRLETIGQSAPAGVEIDRRISGAGGEDVAVVETLTLKGAAASWARSWLLGSPASEHAGMIRRQLDSQGNFTMEKVVLKHAEDRSMPLVLEMHYQVPGAYDGERRQWRVPFFWECDYLSVTPVEDRKAPFLVNPPMKIRSVTRFAGSLAGAVLLPGTTDAGSGTGTVWNLQWKGEGEAAGIHLDVEIPHGQHARTGWADFQNGRRSLVERLRRFAVRLP